MGHTVVSAYGWGASAEDYAVAHGAKPLFDPNSARLMAADPVEELDPKFCQATSSKTNSQCQAYPIAGQELCVGHRNAAEKQQRNQE